jgi:hypothetical protein
MPIHCLKQSWILETKNTGYALESILRAVFAHTYWGKRLPHVEDYPAPPLAEKWASFNNAAHLNP